MDGAFELNDPLTATRKGNRPARMEQTCGDECQSRFFVDSSGFLRRSLRISEKNLRFPDALLSRRRGESAKLSETTCPPKFVPTTVVAEMISELISFEPEICIFNGSSLELNRVSVMRDFLLTFPKICLCNRNEFLSRLCFCN